VPTDPTEPTDPGASRHGPTRAPDRPRRRIEGQAEQDGERTVAEPPTGEEPGPGPDADDPMEGGAPTG
jgi:hypothetical protein